MQSRIPALAFAALCVGAIASPANANLLTNGSFEDTTNFVGDGNDTMVLSPPSAAMTGWTVVSSDLAWIGPTNPYGLTATEGSYFLDLTSYSDSGPFGGVAQSIGTVLGDSYTLTFDLGGSVIYGASDSITACADVSCAAYGIIATGTNDWASETLSFTGTGAPMTISLIGLSGESYIGLDNVSVTDTGPNTGVPEPITLSLFGTGLAGAVAVRRRKKNVR